MSLPEHVLWRELRGRQLDGLRFRRQHPVGRYVLDFFCPALRLAIEVDGRGHELRSATDARRDAELLALDIVTIRIGAAAILSDVDAVTAWLRREIEWRWPGAFRYGAGVRSAD